MFTWMLCYYIIGILYVLLFRLSTIGHILIYIYIYIYIYIKYYTVYLHYSYTLSQVLHYAPTVPYNTIQHYNTLYNITIKQVYKK